MPDPSNYDNKDDFISACISQRQNEHPDEEQDQSIAICYSMWSDKSMKNGKKKESAKQGFGDVPLDSMDECIAALTDTGLDEDDAREWCENMVGASGKPAIVKTTASKLSKGMDFILSDETVDRYGDVIKADGWDLRDFNKNPIALWGHNPNFPIGRWEALHVKDGALRGRLHMAPEGTSERIDELRKLIEAGILKSVSVGFHPIESKPRSKEAPGEIYVKSSLIECSLVSTPANPNALAIAKSMKISAETQELVFAKHGSMKTRDAKVKRPNGAHAEIRTKQGAKTMSLAQRITDTEQRIVSFRDKLNEHIKSVDDENPTDESTAITEELTRKIDEQEKQLEGLKRAEKHLAATSKSPEEIDQENDRGSEQGMVIRNHRPFAAPRRKINPVDYIWRSLTVQVKHFAEKGRRSMVDVLKSTYGEDEPTYAMLNMITRTATTPATTTTSGWAQELVTVAIGEFFDLLQPVSVYARLSTLGGRFTFGSNGIITIPTRSSTTSIGGGFVAQGAAIPVKQAAFTAISLTPKKVGVISSFTREIAEHSTPSIEQLIRDAIVNDTATAIDAILLDTNAATAIRPAGLLNGLSTESKNAGTDITGLIADSKTIMGKLFAGTNGNVRTPVWITTPSVANCIALSLATGSTSLPFKDEVAAGRFMGYPIIQSTNVSSGYLILMDAADFVTATGDAPNFDVSDQAVLHFEDTSPLDITTASVGTTVKSLWQTDSMAIRMRMACNWAMRRTGMIYEFTSLNWGS